MEIDEEEFRRISAFLEARIQEPDPQEQVHVARARLEAVGELLDSVKVIPGGRASAVDRCFRETFLPSDMVRTQLRLAQHYIRSACDGHTPTLTSFVVLRVAIECQATAQWLIADASHRVRVERFLKRMWWDTQSAVDMAVVADANPDLRAVYELEETIHEIAEPIKGLDPEKVTTSKRVALSSIVQEASRAVRPSYPTLMQSCWMACAGVSHGNVPISAGIGVEPHSVQKPSEHPISMNVYANFLEIAVADLQTTVEFFQRYATEEHQNQRPMT
ncbi:hypothetical protein GCM10027052_20110 [Parafrigoribacterium mesophilum]|uniref:hypothetical protein n=1 Tax=Parafrigoribacterium mesophilum TaxID=433646 RepID=UPI0031FC856B